MANRALRGTDLEPAEVPSSRSLKVVREAASACTACDLYKNATQTVFGEGPARPVLVLVGEQPGDREDVEGLPFVGPAGAELDKALVQAGVDPKTVYKTNAVKHFKWRPTSGKRRLHDRPDRTEIEVCKPWLAKELQLLAPGVVIALGTTAATSLIGKATPIGKNRGRPFETELGTVFVTYHPSSILRQKESADRARRRSEIVSDLEHALQAVAAASK